MQATKLSEDVPGLLGVTSIGDGCSSGMRALELTGVSLKEYISKSCKQCSDKLLHHCLPITCLKLLEGIVLVASEGPSLLMKMAHFKEHSFQRCQLFPSQYVISGMEFLQWPQLEVGDPVQWHKRSDKPYDFLYVGFVWAGNFGVVIRVTRSVKCQLKLLDVEEEEEGRCDNKLQNFDFIPVAAKWLEGGNVLALLSVLNYLVLYERISRDQSSQSFTELKELSRTPCSKSETLFSGLISGSSRNDLLIFAGTVFNGVCVWSITGGRPTITHELKCHDGIIFSLEYNSCRQLLLSTSDDRTIGVWKLGNEDGTGAKATLVHKLYGHDARVWKALSIHDYIISVGESSDVRVNFLKDGELHKSWRAHDGAPVFTSVYDEDFEILYTGGSDGSIRKWPKWWYRVKPRILPFDVIPHNPETDNKNRVQGSGRWSGNHDYPKMAILLDINHVLVSMESGRVIGLTWEGKQFDLLHDSRCQGYQIIKISPCHKVLAVAGKDGHLYFAEIFFTENDTSKTSIMCAKKTFMTKLSWHIISMIWLDASRLLIICFNRAMVLLLQENDKGERSDVEFIQTFDLNLPRPGVPAAIEVMGKYLILGDELGALHLFRYLKSNTVIGKFEKAHKDGVTSFLYHNSQLYTSGRDGKVQTFSLKIDPENDQNVEFIPLTSFSFSFDWVTGIYVNMGSMLVCGFQKEDFVVHSMCEKRTLTRIPCGGGGNRKWDFKYGHGVEGSKNASFTFVRDKDIFYTFLPMEGYLNVTLKEGLHSRSVNCAVHLNSSENESCMEYITGSEDGSLKWFQWDGPHHEITGIQTVENHVSSVRSAWKITVSNQTFIFTGGGRSQLCIYRLDYSATGRMNLLKEIVLVKTACKQTEGDVRIMDITVLERGNNELCCFSACSDGYVRILYFNTLSQKFKIAGLLRGNAHAVLRVQLLSHELSSERANKTLLGGVTSNGYFFLWEWDDEGHLAGSLPRELPERTPVFERLLRRTAFLSLKVDFLMKNSEGGNHYRIVCGGDDCSLSVWSLSIISEENNETRQHVYNMKGEWVRDQNQRGAVVGVDADDRLIYAISNDQIVSFWSLQGNLEGTRYAGVSDCQGFLVDKETKCILCFGKGISWIPIPSFSTKH